MSYFSILVAVYNEEKSIKNCIDSLLSQDFQDFEIIVVNDCSTDKTKEILDKNYGKNKKIKIIHKSVNEHKPKAINDGLKLASGEVVAITDADTKVPKDWLSKIKKEFDNDKKLKAIGGVYEAYNNDIVSLTGNLFERIFMDIGLIPNVLPGANAAYVRKDFMEIGGYPVRKWGADSMIDMLMREKGKKIKITKNLIVKTLYPNSLKKIIKRKFVWGGGLGSIIDKTKLRLNFLIRPAYFIILLIDVFIMVFSFLFNFINIFMISSLIFLLLFLIPVLLFIIMGLIWIFINKKFKYIKALPLLAFMPFIQEFSYFVGFVYRVFGGKLVHAWRQKADKKRYS